MARLKDLKVSIGLSKEGLTKLNGDLRSVKSNFKRNFGQIQGMVTGAGRMMTASFTAPLALMGVQSVKAFNEQAKAIAQVEAGLKSTGGQVGYTSTQLQQMASDLQSKTLFGDEEILKNATAQLLTFTNIVGTEFERSQEAALNLATRLDGDLKSASIMLGKALNDPVANLSAMSRAGVQFSDEQKELIKSLVSTGNHAEAQGIILDELEKQYGGSAEAAAEAGTGGFKQLSNMLGDLQEQFGKLIVEFLTPIIPKIKKVISTFMGMSDETKKMVMVVAGVLGAAGPIAMAIGALMPIIMGMTAPVTMFVLAIGAAAVAVFKYRDDIAQPLADVANFFIAIYNEVAAVRIGFKMLDVVSGSVFEVIIQNLLAVFKAVGVVARALTTLLVDRDFEKAKKVYEEGILEIGKGLIESAEEISQDFTGAFDEAMRDQIAAAEPLDGSRLIEFKELANVQLPDLDPDDDDDDPLKKKKKGTEELIAVEKSRMVQLGNLNQIVTDSATETLAAVEANKTLKGSYEQVGASIEPIMGRFAKLGEFAAQKLPGFFQGAFSALSEGTKNFGEFMMDTLKQLLIRVTALAATFAAISILFPGSGAVAGGFGKFMAGGMGLPMMAEGGLFTGASLAMVGEGPGTSMINPEVVAPLDKLQQMMGGGNVVVTGMIRGNDILLSNERSLLDRNRVRGF